MRDSGIIPKNMNPQEVEKMKDVGRIAAEVLSHMEEFVKPGVSTDDLDRIAHERTLSLGVLPAPLNYQGFPKSICTSINEVLCHGVPGTETLKEGDIINIDVTCLKDSFHGDTSRTFFVGKVSEKAREITRCAEEAMNRGIEAIRPGGTVGDIGFAISKFVTRKGFYPVEEIGGHGIGRRFHMDPFVPSVGKKGKGEVLRPWSCITVEPIVMENDTPIKEYDIPSSSIKYYKTGDGGLSAQFEHTILITDESYEVLTKI